MNLSDAEAMELAVIERARESVHELDEAFGYNALIRQDPTLYTVETLAAKVGRSPKYVYGRLKLAELTPNLQKAFYEGKLTVGHAMEIARLQPKDQEQALSECFPGHRTTAAILKDKDPRPISVRELRDWIRREIHLSLAQAPFDVNDPNLLPAAGPCTTCPKRSGSNPLLFADAIKRPDICTDPECFRKKKDTLAVFLQHQDARPLVIGRVLFHHGALSGSVNDIPHKKTIERKLIIPVIRDEYLLSRYQVENTVKYVTHQ